MQPKMTIIMSTYNDAKYISTALKSILRQTFTNWKLILINDASSDNTEEIILELFKNDQRLDYLKNTRQHGVTQNIKRAILRANTPFIARLDSDDYWLDQRKLAVQYKVLVTHPEVGMVGTWAKVVNEAKKALYTIRYPLTDYQLKQRILRENPFVTSSIVFRKPADREVIRVRPSNRFADDYNLCLQIGIRQKFINLPVYATAYRINPEGISQSKQKEQILDTLNVIGHYKKYYSGFLQSYILWTLRMYYPVWLRGKTSMRIKQFLKYY